MPGLDKSRFIGLRQADEELICGICLAILNEPVVTPCCSQTYCGECVREWLQSNNTCPNDRKLLNAYHLIQAPLVLNNILDKLEIICYFNYNGCNKHMSLGELKNHVKVCRYNPDAICDVCNETNGDIDKHNCVHNLLVKNKRIETCNKELLKKYKAIVENVRRDGNDKEIIRELTERNNELNEENNQLKSENFEMNEQMISMVHSITKHRTEKIVPPIIFALIIFNVYQRKLITSEHFSSLFSLLTKRIFSN